MLLRIELKFTHATKTRMDLFIKCFFRFFLFFWFKLVVLFECLCVCVFMCWKIEFIMWLRMYITYKYAYMYHLIDRFFCGDGCCFFSVIYSLFFFVRLLLLFISLFCWLFLSLKYICVCIYYLFCFIYFFI